MRQLKLCFVGWADHVHLERWAGYFAKLGHSVSVISFSGRGSYPEGVQQYPLVFKGRNARWVVLELRYLLWKIRPDIVHVHWAHFAEPVSRAWSGPLAVTAWGSDVYRPEKFSDADWPRLKDGLSAASLITCDSEDLAARVRNEFELEPKRVAVVQWGVDTNVFSPHDGPSRLAQELGIAARPVVFSARNFTPVYNLETVVEVFARVRLKLGTAMLLMKRYGGNPEYAATIGARIEQLGLKDAVRIVETIPYERMPDLYRMANVTISIPLSDATPMALLEAMACGSVPVVSDLPSLREWVRDGWNGFLAEPRDVDRLADCIVRVITEPDMASQLIRRNLEIVQARASQAVNMGRMEALYRELLPARAVDRQGS